MTTWALSTLLIFYLLTSTLGSIVGGAFGTLGNTLSGVATTVGGAAQTAVEAAAPAVANEGDFSAIEDAIPAGTGEDAAALRDAALASVRALVTGDQAQADTAREEAAQAVASARNIPIEEARSQVEELETQYRETAANVREQATEVADTATTAVSTGTLLGALGLVIGAIAAWFGGRSGAVDPTVTSRLTGARRTTRM